MAFVFQASRWTQQNQNTAIGPGYYKPIVKKHCKMGIISPEIKVQKPKVSSSQIHADIARQQQQRKIKQKEQGKQNKNLNKQYKRAESAKLLSHKKQYMQAEKASHNKILFNQRNANLFVQITSSSKRQQKTFQNKKIRKSLINTTKQTIHSGNELENNIKQMFSDKNIRILSAMSQNMAKSHQMQQQSFKRENYKMTLRSFARQAQQIKQNNFIAVNPNLNNFFTDKQNFIIASDNRKLQRVQKQKLSNELKINKNQNRMLSDFDQKEDMQTTGIQDSQLSSYQYLTDATPGPGQYNLNKQQKAFKSVVQKFGITQQRFKQNLSNDKKLILNLQSPNYHRSSQASQQKVGFGKSRPTTAVKQQPFIDIQFYDDHKSMENKCLKNLIKDRISPGSFLTNCDRFLPKKKDIYQGPDFFDIQKGKGISLPDPVFMSNISRQQIIVNPTGQINYQGQDYNTISRKLSKVIQQKQYRQNEYPGFSYNAPRFIEKKQKRERPESHIFYRQSKRIEKAKAFTFRKQQGKINSVETPAPGTYETYKKWIKPSHHIRFKF